MVCPGGGFRDNGAVRVRFLLGPAGAGKTFRCLTEVRQALWASPEGAPLLLVAPKQMTYQLERQLLADPLLPGYTRLHILSFERLAHFIFGQLGRRAPEMLDEEGRLMVLRALLARKRDDLKLFRASARLTGFAQQLAWCCGSCSATNSRPRACANSPARCRRFRAWPPSCMTWRRCCRIILTGSRRTTCRIRIRCWQRQRKRCGNSKVQGPTPINRERESKVQSRQPGAGSQESGIRRGEIRNPKSERPKRSPVAVPSDFGLRTSDFFRPSDFGLRISSLWVDGFAEFSDQELDLVAALLPCCEAATISFCLDRAPSQKVSWLSSWSVTRKTFEDCRKRFGGVADADIVVEVLERRPDKGRFADSPVLCSTSNVVGLSRSLYDPGRTSNLEP